MIRSEITTNGSKKRVYDALMGMLRQAILSGDLAPGVALASEHELAQKHGISRMSVRQALQNLEQDALILRKPGKGWFVRDPSGVERPVHECFVDIGLDIGLDNPWYGARIAAGIKSGSFPGSECRLVLLNPGEFDRLRSDWVDGAVLAGVEQLQECHRLFDLLEGKGITPVLFNRISERENVSYVSVNYRRESELAVRSLIAAGRRRIGVVTGSIGTADFCNAPRYRGYCDAMGQTVEEAAKSTYFVTDDSAALAGVTQFIREFNPDAIFVTYGFIAPLVLRAAINLNRQLPDELQILCFDDISHLAPVFPGSFQYVEMPLERMARDAAEFIAARAAGTAGRQPLKKMYQARLADMRDLRIH